MLPDEIFKNPYFNNILNRQKSVRKPYGYQIKFIRAYSSYKHHSALYQQVTAIQMVFQLSNVIIDQHFWTGCRCKMGRRDTLAILWHLGVNFIPQQKNKYPLSYSNATSSTTTGALRSCLRAHFPKFILNLNYNKPRLKLILDYFGCRFP